MVLTGRGFICMNHLDGVERRTRRCYFPKRKLNVEDEGAGDASDPPPSLTAPDRLRLDPSPFCLAAACQNQHDWGRSPEELASAPYSKTHFIISPLTARRRAFRVAAAVLLFDEPHHLSGGIGCQSGMSASF